MLNDVAFGHAKVDDKLPVQAPRIEGIEHSDECRTLQFWKAHQLSDNRWSFHVTANYRLTFAVADERQEVSILDLEDDH